MPFHLQPTLCYVEGGYARTLDLRAYSHSL
jgi:hypothetical protein